MYYFWCLHRIHVQSCQQVSYLSSLSGGSLGMKRTSVVTIHCWDKTLTYFANCCQSFIQLPLLGHSPNFSPSKDEFTNVFGCIVIVKGILFHRRQVKMDFCRASKLELIVIQVILGHFLLITWGGFIIFPNKAVAYILVNALLENINLMPKLKGQCDSIEAMQSCLISQPVKSLM